MQESDIKLNTFCSIRNLKSLGKGSICFENQNNPSCLYLLLINTTRSFEKTQLFETGLSDFYKLVVTVRKSTFPKSPPKITYRSHKNFSNNLLRDNVNSLLSKGNITPDFTSKIKIFIKTFIKHAPVKKK